MPRNDKTLGLLFAKQSIVETRNYFHVKGTVLISRPVTCSSPQRWCRTFLSISTAVAVLVAASAAMPQVTYARTDTSFVAIPLVRSRQNHLMVRAFINGREAWLTIDSGAPVSAIAANRRNFFRLKPITAKSNLPSRIQINGAFNNVAIARELRLGGLTLIDEPVVTVDLGNSARSARLAHDEQFDGIIGADILFPTQAVLDCQRQLLILKTDPDALGGVPGFDRRGLQAVPIQVSDGFNLYVNGSINGKPAKFMVDTGSFATLLHRSFVRRMRIATRETPYSSSAVNLKDRGLRVAKIRNLSVGSVNIAGKDVGVIDMEGLIHDGLLEGSPPVAGLLGAETLRRHHGIIDFGTRTLYLQQRELPWQRIGWRRSAGPNFTY
ncbi:MAG: Aspartyl protease [Candidatus Udaeobacter sp.]|nr:MAG: Aspartyl protease [Candidatus Udaeobacter sp.]